MLVFVSGRIAPRAHRGKGTEMTGSIADAVSGAATEQPTLAPLHQTAMTATDYWNDSCSIEELTYAIERGAVGATSNPTIVGEVLGKEMPLWRERIGEIIATHPTWTEDEVAWQLIEEMAVARLEAPPARVRARGPAQGTAVDPDQSEALPRHRAARCPGDALCRSGAEHADQDPGHASGHRRDRGSHRRGGEHQRHRVLHGAASARRGRCGAARPGAPRVRRRGHQPRCRRCARSWSAG